MKRNKRLFAAIALGSVLATGAVGAAAFDGHKGGCRDGGLLGAAYRLDTLTPEQRTQLDALREQARAQMEQGRDERRALHQALRDGADVDAVRPLAEKQGQRVAAMIVKKAEMRAALNEILTDAQREELAAKKGGKRGMHRQHQGFEG